ncbi:MAG: hypothetical protein NUV31_06670 [Dehalococcoidales bacterium]|nr:hypothetical protein [Dehalococcoidales bacterium]
MSPRKFDQYIFTRYREIPPEMQKIIDATPIESTPLLWLDDKVARGSFYIECHWIWSMQTDNPVTSDKSHTHDFDEVLTFIGSNKNNPHDLGAELHLYIEDEKYIIDKTCFVFIPRGTKHLPLVFVKIRSPFVFLTAGNGTAYGRVTEDK